MTQRTLQEAASHERSVSQERAFIRGAQWAAERIYDWLNEIKVKQYIIGIKGIEDDTLTFDFIFDAQFYKDYLKQLQ